MLPALNDTNCRVALGGASPGLSSKESCTYPNIVIYCDSKYWTLNSVDPINTLREGKPTLISPFDVRGSSRLSSVVISPNGIRGVVSNFSA